jgi:hypothetical protein
LGRSSNEARPGLCYDTQRVEAMPFPVAMPDKTPWALSSDLYQEKLLGGVSIKLITGTLLR